MEVFASYKTCVYCSMSLYNIVVPTPLLTATNLNPHWGGLGDDHFATHLVIGNHSRGNLVGP